MQQLPFFGMMPHSDWVPTPVQDLPQDWSGFKHVAMDVETKDPDIFDKGCGARREGCHVAGFALSFGVGHSYYLPVRHEEGGNLELANVRRYLDDHFKDFQGRIYGAELTYDIDFCLEEVIRFHDDVLFDDVATRQSLIDEYQDNYRLDTIGKSYGFQGKDERLLRAAASFYPGGADNPKSVIYRLHSRYIGPYAIRDVELPLQIAEAQDPIIRHQELERAVDLEARVLPVTVLMRRHGIRINQDALGNVERWTVASQHARLAQFHHLTGIAVTMDDLRAPIVMQSIMGKLGLPPLPMTRKFNRKTKQYEDNQPSIKSDILKTYRDPRVDLLADARKLDKLVTTYIPSMHKYMVKGRINGTLKSVRGNREGGDNENSDDQSGTVSRRFAHVHPNLGNQPNPTRDEDDALRVEMGVRWRSIFEPDDPANEDWGLADFSQQEPRWIVHDAEGLGLQGARTMADAFRADPRTDNHKMISDLTKLPRGPAKVAFLAFCYGAGKAKTAKQMEDKLRELDKLLREHPSDPKALALGPDWPLLPEGWMPTYVDHYQPGDWTPPHKCVGDEYDRPDPICEAIINQFDRAVPYVKQLARRCSDRAKERGYILLIDGGRARLERDDSGNLREPHKALNRRAQGNGAIQLKLGLVALRRAGLLPNMTVHDDVSKPVPKGEAGTRQLFRIKEICEGVVRYVEPSRFKEERAKDPYVSRVPFLVKVKRGSSYGTADSAKEIMEAA